MYSALQNPAPFDGHLAIFHDYHFFIITSLIVLATPTVVPPPHPQSMVFIICSNQGLEAEDPPLTYARVSSPLTPCHSAYVIHLVRLSTQALHELVP